MVFADSFHSLLADEGSVFFEHLRDVFRLLELVLSVQLHSREADQFRRLHMLCQNGVNS